MTIQTTYNPKWKDACFYEPSVIATVTGRKGKVYVEVQGDLRLYHDDHGSISRSDDLRRLWPQGGELDDEKLREMGWDFGNNRWWAVTRDNDPSGEDDDVCDSYESALEAAKELAGLTDGTNDLPHHTPGPWTTSPTILRSKHEGPRIVVWAPDYGGPLTAYGRTDEEAVANAYLGAAAPELLAVAGDLDDLIRDLRAQSDSADNGGDVDSLLWSDDTDALVERLRAAIAKATRS
jgi:hypothetical protein